MTYRAAIDGLVTASRSVSKILERWPDVTDTEVHNAKVDLQQALSVIEIEASARKQKAPRFDGRVYDPQFDDSRLRSQLRLIFDVMRGGGWKTLPEISHVTGCREASISAQLRHLRKPRFGSYIVDRRYRGDRARGIFEYRLLDPTGQIVPEIVRV